MKNLLHILNGILAVLGRVLLCVTILGALCYTAPGLKGLSQGISTAGAVSSHWAFVVAIAILVIGAASVVVGYRARIGAALLLVLLALGVYTFQGLTFWTLVSADVRQEQVIGLLTYVSLMGAMLFIVANGPGQMSLDAKRR